MIIPKGKVLPVAWILFLETMEQPATLFLYLIASITTLITPLFQFQRFSEDGRVVRDSALAMTLLMAILLLTATATQIYHALKNGTAAATLAKPISRLQWFIGNCLGVLGVLIPFLLLQSVTILLAEYFSPHYHTTGNYADVGGVLSALGLIIVALVLAALNNRFRKARFVLSATLLMPLVLLAYLPWTQPHWGTLTGVLVLFMLLVQYVPFATALSLVMPAGFTLVIVPLTLPLLLYFAGGSAFLPLDFLSDGGHIPCHTIGFLLPQTIFVPLFIILVTRHFLRR